MKRVIIFLLSIVAWSNSINVAAQDNGYTMLKDGTVWCYVYSDFVKFNFNYFSYIVDGDTVVNNKAYKKIYYYEGEYDPLTASPCYPLREENQKVYCPHEIKNEYMSLDMIDGETLLYDFTLDYDDTFGRDAYTDEPCKVWLIEVNELADGPRKFFYLNGPLHGGWGEGIGSLGASPLGGVGLYVPLTPYVPSSYATSLMEFMQDGQMIYSTPNLNLAKDGIRWRERESLQEAGNYSLIDYRVNGDTLINRRPYKKVYSNDAYQGAIRMNIEHKVYYWRKGLDKEILLYDFDWIVCKELSSTNYSYTDFILVDTEHMGGIYQDMKTTLLDGKEYDYRILDSNPNPEGIPFHTLSKEVRLIKDIGLTSGIFSHVEVSKENARTYNDLVSVYDGDKLIYLNPAFKENGELETSISTVAAELHLQVTASNGEAVFTLQEGSKKANTLLQIYSVDGRLVTTRSLNSGTATVGNLPQGVYYYRTESGQGMPANGKFLME